MATEETHAQENAGAADATSALGNASGETDVAAPAESVPAAPEKKKKRRFRRLKRLLIAFAALVAAVLIAAAFFLGPIVKFGVNTFGASALGVDACRLEEAKIYPLAGYVRLEGLFVGKPLAEGVSFSRDMLTVGLVEIDFDMSTLFAKKKIFDRFEVRRVSVNYEQLLGGQKNIGVLMENLAGEPSPEKPAPEPKAESGADEEIFIGARYFVVADVNVAAYIRGMPLVFPSLSADFSRGVGIDENLTPVAFGMKVAGNFMNVIEFFRDSVFGEAAGAAWGAVSDAAAFTGDAAKAAAGATADVVSGAATLTGDAAMATAGAVSGAASATGRAAKDAATLTTDAAKATADAVSGAAGAVSDFLFRSEEKKENSGEK